MERPNSYRLHHDLHQAARLGNLQDQGVQQLIAEGVDVNSEISDMTALHEAACWGNLEAVQVLINHNADANKGQVSKPLHGATLNGHLNIVQAILNSNAYIDILDKLGRTALFCAALKGSMDIVHELVDREANLSASCYGLTPADIADIWGHTAINVYLTQVMQERRVRRLAFLMARHPRIGAASPANVLPREIFFYILSFRGM